MFKNDFKPLPINGKDEVAGSSPAGSSSENTYMMRVPAITEARFSITDEVFWRKFGTFT